MAAGDCATDDCVISQLSPLLLGSGSPRRREIVQTLRIPMVAIAARANEALLSNEHADGYIVRVTLEKLRSIATAPEIERCGAILVADTIVVVDGQILNKPRDVTDAERMLTSLSGRGHEVWTRFLIAACGNPQTPAHGETVMSSVFFRRLSPREITDYARSGEGLDKAGAYAVQGIGAFAIRRIEGSYGNVVGLPSCEVVAALLKSGLLARFPL